MIKTLLKSVIPKNTRWQLIQINWRIVKKLLEALGYTVALRKDYYSPLSSVTDLKATANRWNRPSALEGVTYDLEKMKSKLAGLVSKYSEECSALPSFEKLKDAGYGVGFTEFDGLTLYMMVREIKPKRYIEVGSGLSTYYCSLAAAKNESEGYPLQITCIEPFPYKKLYTIPGIEIAAKEVQDIKLSLFQQLEENDIFFIDSSHMLKIDSDVAFLYLEVLPVLKVGVNIHIHDINFPYNIPYPEQAIYNEIWPTLWNEAMLVQAFLCYNNKFKIELSTPLLRYFDGLFLKEIIPLFHSVAEIPNSFCSMWLKRYA